MNLSSINPRFLSELCALCGELSPLFEHPNTSFEPPHAPFEQYYSIMVLTYYLIRVSVSRDSPLHPSAILTVTDQSA